MPKISLLPCVKVEVKGRVKGHGSRSKSTFGHAVVNIRGSALPSAAKRCHYHSKVFVCKEVDADH